MKLDGSVLLYVMQRMAVLVVTPDESTNLVGVLGL